MHVIFKTILIVSLMSFYLLNSTEVKAEEEVNLSDLFGGPSEFLDVDEAFKVSSEIVDDEVIIRFDIADEYYLYKSRFNFSANNASLSDAYIPDGKKKVDEYLGNVEVYYHNLEISNEFQAHQKDFTFTIEYQGCAEAGLCYPPEEKTFSLVASKVTPLNESSAQNVESEIVEDVSVVENSIVRDSNVFVPEQEKVSNFLSDKSILEIIFYMILLGIGLAFTPDRKSVV